MTPDHFSGTYCHRRTVATYDARITTTTTRATSDTLPLLALGVVVVLWGAGPVVTKLITVHPLIGTSMRFLLSIPVLYAIVHLRGGAVSRDTFRAAALPGLAFGINLIFVFAAVQEVAVAVLAVMVALQPAILLVVAGPLLGERATATQAAWTLVGVAATAGVILGAGDELRANVLGVVLAASALSTFMVYFVLTRRARSTTDVDPFEWMAAINVWSFIATIVPSLAVIRPDDFDEFDGTDLFWLAVLAYLTGVAGHVLMSWVHGYVEASKSALYLLGMNVFAIGLAWPVHDEPINLLQVACGVVVFAAVGAVIRLPARAA